MRIRLAASCLTLVSLGIVGSDSRAAKPVAAVVEPELANLMRGYAPPMEAIRLLRPVLLERELKAAGYDIKEFSFDRLLAPDGLTAGKIDLLVLPDASLVSATVARTIERYLQQGGDLIALKTPLGRHPLIKADGRWVNREEYEKKTLAEPPPKVLFDFASPDLSGWHRVSNHPERTTSHEIVADGPSHGLQALHVTISDLEGWDTYNAPARTDFFPEGHAVTIFNAKGGPRTPNLSIEWEEKDGSRWIAVVPLSTQWKRYVLAPQEFHYWESNPARGRGDRFNPANVAQSRFGLAFSHTGPIGGKHEYWITNIGTAPLTAEYEQLVGDNALPKLDTISPSYKLFTCYEVASLVVRDDQVIVSPQKITVPGEIRSPQPRARGAGFNKGRAWRWIPLLEARTASGQWRGTPATLTIHTDGPFKGGAWASFGIDDDGWYLAPEVLQTIRAVATWMRQGICLLDGGAECYTYFADQDIKLGLQAARFNGTDAGQVEGRITLVDRDTGQQVWERTWPVHIDRQVGTVSESFKPGRWPDQGFLCTAEIRANGATIDRVAHEVHVLKPKPQPRFVMIKDGQFLLDGKPWRAHGINYMPSSGMGTEDGDYFESWTGPRAYDPEVIQRDLEHIKDLGYNAVSIFTAHHLIRTQNTIDLLRRLDKLGLKANLSLRPGTPMDFPWSLVKEMIEYQRLAPNDTVFAYDLAWEPAFGRHDQRKVWDGEWANWVIERYGHIENAEKDWQFRIARDAAGRITNPSREQVDTNGPWYRMVAAYRRFLDTLLYKKYSDARRLVRSIDPNHHVSFRMSEAGDPTLHWDGLVPYDFPYLVMAVDFLAPEAYGRIGDWEKVKPGWFERAYARWADPNKPMIWAEMGVSTWYSNMMRNSPEQQWYQAEFYGHFYRMLIASGADGLFSWYYPGGFRVYENSDYGVISPDGSDRPVTKVIRENSRAFLGSPPAKPIDHWIEFDRDARAEGIVGAYEQVQAGFWNAIKAGKNPGLKTAGTGTNSANCPLIAVGNTPCNGTNPPKFLDAVFDAFAVQDAKGRWVTLTKGGQATVNPDQPVVARMTVANLGEAEWLAPPGGTDSASVSGAVYFTSQDRQGSLIRTGLPKPVAHRDTIEVQSIQLAPANLKAPATVTVSLLADQRTPFGEKFTLTLVPLPQPAP